MEVIGHIDHLEIVYIKYSLEEPWFNSLPNANWFLFAITEKDNTEIFGEINRRVIENNVNYVCSAGEKCELFHDLLDEDIVIRDVENQYLPDHLIMTTWHHDFDEGFWFACNQAYGNSLKIKKLVCLDITSSNYKPKLIELIEKIDGGWLPPE